MTLAVPTFHALNTTLFGVLLLFSLCAVCANGVCIDGECSGGLAPSQEHVPKFETMKHWLSSHSQHAVDAEFPATTRVCFVAACLGGMTTGGIGTATTNLALYLATQPEFKVHIVSAFAGKPGNETVAWYAERQVNLHVFDHSEAKGVVKVPVEVLLHFLHTKEEYDIVIVHDYMGVGYHLQQAKIGGQVLINVPIIIWAHSTRQWHDLGNSYIPNWQHFPRVYQWERFSIEAADAIISPSQYQLDFYRQHGYCVDTDPSANCNTLDHHAMRPRPVLVQPYIRMVPEVVPIEEKFEAQYGGRVFAFFGRLEARKGLVEFCEAIAMLVKSGKYEGLDVMFVGSEVGDAIGHWSSQYAIEQQSQGWYNDEEQLKVNFEIFSNLGSNEALQLLKSTDNLVAVTASQVENSPLVVYELSQLGIPFIATGIGGIPELVHDEFHSLLLVEPTARALYELMERWMSESLEDELFAKASPLVREALPEVAGPMYSEFLRTIHRTNFENAKKLPSVNKLELLDEKPLVSILVASRNRPQMVREALNALLVQTYPNIEILVGDDASDDPYDLEHCLLENVVCYRSPVNLGAGLMRNKLSSMGRGEFLFIFDDDNTPYENAVEKLVGVLVHSGADAVAMASRSFVVDDSGRDEGQILAFDGSAGIGVFENHLADAAALIRRSSFEEIGGFLGINCEDHELYTRMVLLGGQHILTYAEPLYEYVLHPLSITNHISPPRLLKYRVRLIQLYVQKYPELSSLFFEANALVDYVKLLSKLQDDASIAVADSFKDFSLTAKAHGWTYFASLLRDGTTPFNIILSPRVDDNGVEAWFLEKHLAITNGVMQPDILPVLESISNNARFPVSHHLVVRRWTSSEEMHCKIVLLARRPACMENLGDGVVLSVVVDEAILIELNLEAWDTVSHEESTTVFLKKGSTVDLSAWSKDDTTWDTVETRMRVLRYDAESPLW